jgi:hypothetical protein
MTFLKPEIFEDSYFEVETNTGTEIVPCSVCGVYVGVNPYKLKDYLSGQPYDDDYVRPKHGWVARMSAPGYLDCTDWVAFNSKEDAEDYLDDQYGEDA